ncbi:hypothetical protein HPB47_005559 [Ixodes persulcatus]|uniref:Uncharacterized protein n=1 Tax=Ixodes persulcatus TaxID=34615 RepID=A0AC60PCL0_IXOPE|nr:hypothetical protein HPB47_005559 [Ixodes persulcatus]
MEDPLDGSTVDVAKNGGPTVVSMVGEDVDPDFCAGWMRARARGGTQVEKEPRPSSYVAGRSSKRVGLEGENKVVVRPRGGLDLRKTSIVVVAAAIRAAAGISEEEASLDTQCPNVQQNVVVISTGSDARAVRYAAVTCICVAGRSYEVRAYVTAPFDTVKGVIRGVPVHHTAEEIERLLIGPRNPTVRAAERIGSSATVVVIFGGDVVPHQVFYGGSVLRCSLYRKHYEVCKTCGRVGHRTDVCPTPGVRRCLGCGGTPDPGHACSPRCGLCGGPHVTGDKVCKNRFRTPYIVRRRLWERAERGLSGDRPSPPPRGSEEKYPRLGRSRSRSRESERPAARSRSRSTSGQVSWAQAVQSDRGEVAKLREENRRQAAEVVELRRENKKLPPNSETSLKLHSNLRAPPLPRGRREGRRWPIARTDPPSRLASAGPRAFLEETVEELKALVEGLVRRLDSSAPPSGSEDSAPPAKRRSVEARRRRGEGVEDRFEEIEGRVGLVEDGQYIRGRGVKPDVIMVQEVVQEDVSLPGYVTYRSSGGPAGRRRGVCTFVRRSLPVLVHELKGGDENVERVLTEVLVGRLGVCLCNVYSNPRFGRQRFRNLLHGCARWADGRRLVVSGDFNARHEFLGHAATTVKGRNLFQDAEEVGLILVTDPGEFRPQGLVNWDAFRRLGPEGEISDLGEWSASLVDAARSAERPVVVESEDVGLVDSRLGALVEARDSLRSRWRERKNNRALRKRVAQLNEDIRRHCEALSRQQWDDVCNRAEGKMHSGDTWKLLRHLLDESRTRSFQCRRMGEVVGRAVRELGEEGVRRQLLDTFLPSCGREVHPEYTGAGSGEVLSAVSVRTSNICEVEETAISLAASLPGTKVVMSDSMSAIRNFARGRVGVVAKRLLRPTGAVDIVWCPAHEADNVDADRRARELLGRAFGGAAEYSPSGFGEVLRTRREDRRVFPPPHGDLVREDAVLLRQLQVECVFTPGDKCVLCGARATAEHVLWDCETRPAEAATSSGLPPDIKAGVMASSLDLQVAVVQQAGVYCAGRSDLGPLRWGVGWCGPHRLGLT